MAVVINKRLRMNPILSRSIAHLENSSYRHRKVLLFSICQVNTFVNVTFGYNRRVLPVDSPNASPAKRRPIPVWGWLILGLAIRLLIAPLGAHPGDFATLTRWADALQAH